MQKEWERKESLLLRSASLLERAKQWEHALPILKDLARVYETVLFDYRKLADVLRRRAALVDKIVLSSSSASSATGGGGGGGGDAQGALRLEPEYFLVAFRGAGLPVFLKVNGELEGGKGVSHART